MELINELLKSFQFERVLSHDVRTKTANVLGRSLVDGKSEPCIFLIELLALEPSELDQFSVWFSNAQLINQNDIYSWLVGSLGKCPIDRKTVKLQVICPAKPAHILKYSAQERFIVKETPEIYEKVTKQFIDSRPTNQIQWVYNILDGTAEQESVIYCDSDKSKGFVLLPDSKWDKKRLDNLYCQALVQDRSLKSLRDLTCDHLPLLCNMRDNIFDHLEKTYSSLGEIEENKLRYYFHYQPSYYHLHLHVTTLAFEGPGQFAGQAHLLDTVIDNLELEKKIRAKDASFRYYKQATIPFVYGSQHPLSSLLP